MPGVSNVFTGFGVEFAAGTPVGGITAYDLGTGSQVANEATSGSVYPEYPTLNNQEPRGSFTTLQVARALGLCGLTGASIGDLPDLKYYLRKAAEGSTRASGSVHNKYTISEGIVYPTTLTCDQGGDATITYNMVISYDGSNNPIVVAVNQALPAGLVDDQRFTLGPVTIESITCDHLRQFSIDFGINVIAESSDGEVWPRYAWIESITPTLTLTGINPQWFGASGFPLIGTKVTHGNTSVYLRKRAEGSTFVADGTAQHVKFTAAGLMTADNALQFSGQGAAETTLSMPLYYDGSNAPLTINTASAIS